MGHRFWVADAMIKAPPAFRRSRQVHKACHYCLPLFVTIMGSENHLCNISDGG